MAGDALPNDGKQTLIVLAAAAAAAQGRYSDFALTEVDDHVIRTSVVTDGFFWHRHPDSDQAFLVIEGLMLLETANERVEMVPRQLYTVPAGVAHVTSPLKDRAVTLTFERLGMITERVSFPSTPHGG